MAVPLLDLKAQYATIADDVREAIDAVCESQYFILGPTVAAFEKRIADYCGTAHAIGVSSGTDAILVSLMALGVGPGDAVITTPYTFFATLGCVSRLGATPVLADIDPVTWNLDPERVRALLENWPAHLSGVKPKVLMPVHLYGQSADMDPLMALAREHGLAVVEDGAQAIGVQYPSADGVKRTGSMGELGCFSFFPSKNLGGFGDGGAVVTNDPALDEKVRCLRAHGSKPKYYHRMVGGNFRLDALQAAVLDVKLNYLDRWHAARRVNAEGYTKAFEGSGVRTPKAIYADSGVEQYHIYNQYVVSLAERDKVRAGMKEAGVGCEIYYPVPMHLQECFAELGYRAGDFPVSEQAAAETLAIPVYPELATAQKQEVVETLLKLTDA